MGMTRKQIQKKNTSKWRDDLYVKINDLAKSGMSKAAIARTIGVTIPNFEKWLKKRPILQTYLDNAKKSQDAKSDVKKFIDYVYEQLPEELQDLWDDINAIENERNAIRKIEFILQDHGTKVRQHLFMHALVYCNFNVSKALKKINITRKVFQQWIDTDPDFPDLIDEMNFHKKNFFEGALVGLVDSGDTAAILFANKTLNRDRGYGEKTEVNVTGSVDHAHVVTVDSLDLPLDVRQQVLQAMREKRALEEKNTINVLPMKRVEHKGA